jgi:hypothetical protein
MFRSFKFLQLSSKRLKQKPKVKEIFGTTSTESSMSSSRLSNQQADPKIVQGGGEGRTIFNIHT